MPEQEKVEKQDLELYSVSFRDGLTKRREVVVLHALGEIDALVRVSDAHPNPLEDFHITPLGDIQVGIVRTVYKENGRKDHDHSSATSNTDTESP